MRTDFRSSAQVGTGVQAGLASSPIPVGVVLQCGFELV